MKTLNEDSPYVCWIKAEPKFKKYVPEEAVDLCEDCAERIVFRARRETGATEDEIFVDGGDSAFISNECDHEMFCDECGKELYTELIEKEDLKPKFILGG